MRIVSLIIFLFSYSLVSLAQLKIASTDQFSVEQSGKTVFSVAMAELDDFEVKSIGDVKMFNSKGEEKNIRKNVRGILLRDALNKLTLDVTSTKELNRYIFLIEASDGYKVVLSRNEVFNTDNLYIVSESNGIPMRESSDRMEILALSQTGKGHIYIKGLRKITVLKID